MVASHLLGFLLGCVLLALLKPASDLRGHLVVAATIGNTGNLPLVLIGSLAADPAMAWLGPGSLGEQYIMLGGISATLIQFPVGMWLMRPKSPLPASPDAPPSSLQQPPTTNVREQELQQVVTQPSTRNLRAYSGSQEQEEATALLLPKKASLAESGSTAVSVQSLISAGEGGRAGGSAPSTPHAPVREGQSLYEDGEVPPRQPLLGVTADQPQHAAAYTTSALPTALSQPPPAPSLQGKLRSAWRELQPAMAGVLSPPTIACAIGLAIASIPELQVTGRCGSHLFPHDSFVCIPF